MNLHSYIINDLSITHGGLRSQSEAALKMAGSDGLCGYNPNPARAILSRSKVSLHCEHPTAYLRL